MPDTLLAEVLTISNNFTRPSTSLRILTAGRNNIDRIDQTNSFYLKTIDYRVIADTTLNQIMCKNVFISKTELTVLFTQNQGIIAFLKNPDERFYLR